MGNPIHWTLIDKNYNFPYQLNVFTNWWLAMLQNNLLKVSYIITIRKLNVYPFDKLICYKQLWVLYSNSVIWLACDISIHKWLSIVVLPTATKYANTVMLLEPCGITIYLFCSYSLVYHMNELLI